MQQEMRLEKRALASRQMDAIVCSSKSRASRPHLRDSVALPSGTCPEWKCPQLAVLLTLGLRRRLWVVNLFYIGMICWNLIVVVSLALHKR